MIIGYLTCDRSASQGKKRKIRRAMASSSTSGAEEKTPTQNPHETRQPTRNDGVGLRPSVPASSHRREPRAGEPPRPAARGRDPNEAASQRPRSTIGSARRRKGKQKSPSNPEPSHQRHLYRVEKPVTSPHNPRLLLRDPCSSPTSCSSSCAILYWSDAAGAEPSRRLAGLASSSRGDYCLVLSLLYHMEYLTGVERSAASLY